MTLESILIANRGEIAIRIARAAADLGLRAVTVATNDDADSLHTTAADECVTLPGVGARGYLDADAIIKAAKESGCDAIHPGYGFLSERSEFAVACGAADLRWIGPSASLLARFGDKGQARAAAIAAGVPVNAGVDHPVDVTEAAAFMASLGPGRAVILKAVAGGGGRGTEVVTDAAELGAAFDRCQAEALLAFGSSDLYVEAFMPRARHVEVQILGDGQQVTHLWERECSVQRRYQKLIEIAPAPHLSENTRDAMIDAAQRLAHAHGYDSLGTFEFLIDDSAAEQPFVFIEATARLQVEHTVTEEVTGVDLVQTQIRLAAGATLAELGLAAPPAPPRGFAIQARINMETLRPDGSVVPGGGTLTRYEPPTGPGVRTDGFGYGGYRTTSAFDSLLAKVIVHSRSPDFAQAARRGARALAETRMDGVRSNVNVLRAILEHQDFVSGTIHTRWVEEEIAVLAAEDAAQRASTEDDTPEGGYAGARVMSKDPLALFAHDAAKKAAQAQGADEQTAAAPQAPDGTLGLASPIQGTVAAIDVAEGDAVHAGQQVAIVEAMKMEHVIAAEQSGIVRTITMSVGDVVREGWPIVYLEAGEVNGVGPAKAERVDPDHVRADLQEALDRHRYTLDEARGEAVRKRHARGGRMPRENIAELLDPGSFKEYWPLVVARQHRRHDAETLRRKTPADGVVAGTGTINAELFGEEAARAMVVHYDYTVLAGTQGARNHYKQDRMFDLAHRFRLPLVLYGEGGGGRPGDDNTGPAVAFDTHTFTQFSKLSGLVPLVGVNHGRCFAGNTALLACCDVIIATKASTIAMGGPAMIEGGGLGVYTPEEVGPMAFQVPNGVVDILVEDEAESVRVAKRYLSYFQGRVDDWSAPDQRPLRHLVPENRLRLYDMREVIETLADTDSVLELRRDFGVGVITAFMRIEGRPVGVIANNPHHLAGAIDSDGADKGARFMQLCDAFDIPIVSLMDCPGMMVGPDVERTALVRHCVRMFNTGANLTVPLFGVVIRKAYGLGVQAMCGASALVGFFTVAWPTAEFAGMNIEGSVKLGYRNELADIEDPEARIAEFERRVARAYESAKAVNAAAGGGLDDVIDPADTREWIASALKRVPAPAPREGKKYAFVDTW